MKPYLLYGEDDFSRQEFLHGLREAVGTPEVQEANTVVLSGAAVTPQELSAACAAVPFLAERRLVVVEGLLGLFEERGDSGPSGRSDRSKIPILLERWEKLPELLADGPETTTLVFNDGKLGRNNALLRRLAPLLEAREFRPLAGRSLEEWIEQRASRSGARLTPRALRQLVNLVGGNLWTLNNEVEKLSLYAAGGVIDEAAVAAVVPRTRETSVFAVVDAVLEGRAVDALQLCRRLERGEARPSRVLGMLARQVRLVLLAQDLLSRGVRADGLGERLGLRQEFAVRRTREQAERFSVRQVQAMHAALLEADLAIKRGHVEEGLALELLLVELARKARERRTASRSLGTGPR